MPAYRFYYLDSKGHFAGAATVVEFPDDQGAIEAAESLLDERSIEVWDGTRIVIRLEPRR